MIYTLKLGNQSGYIKDIAFNTKHFLSRWKKSIVNH